MIIRMIIRIQAAERRVIATQGDLCVLCLWRGRCFSTSTRTCFFVAHRAAHRAAHRVSMSVFAVPNGEQFEMQPLPACVRKATDLLGRDGELVVFPHTRRALMQQVAAFGFQPAVLERILDQNAVVTGSFLLRFFMQGAQWKPGDIEIFGDAHALEVAEFWLWKPDNKIEANYSGVFAKESAVQEVVTWTSDAQTKLQFICVRGDPELAIREFDLPLLQLWFDGQFAYVPARTHEAMQERACALHIPFALTPFCAHEVALPDVLLKRFGRALKYAARGFGIRLPRCIPMTSLYDWNYTVNTASGEVAALLRWAYFVPKHVRAAYAKAAAKGWLCHLPCTIFRRKGRVWLTRDDVHALHQSKTLAKAPAKTPAKAGKCAGRAE